MKKKIFALLLIFIILITSVVIYLNKDFLPTKIQSLIIITLKQKTGKDTSLGSLQFSIFKGLVLRDLKVYDDKKTLLSVKELTCSFLIFPIFQKQLIIPGVSIKDAQIFIHRRSDGTFNVADLFASKETPASKAGFNILLRKIKITNSRIQFQDDAVTPAFTKNLDIKKAILSLSLPADVKFQLLISAPLQIKANGVYHILKEQFSARVELDNLSPQEFTAYYSHTGLKFTGGAIDAVANLNFKDQLVTSDITAKAKALGVSKDKISITLNSPVQAKLSYNTKNKELVYSLILDIAGSPDLVIGDMGRLSGISGRLELNPRQVKWTDLSFKYQDIPYKTSGVLTDFSSPKVELKLASQDLTLDSRFSFKDKQVSIPKLYGHYAQSLFALAGVIDTADVDNLNAKINGEVKLNLEDLKLKAIKPSGIARIKLTLSGKLKDIKSCFIDADISGSVISLYGLKTRKFFLNYKQGNGLASIPLAHISLYGGGIDASARMNIDSKDLPYWVEASMQGVKIEQLKLDTGAKKTDISGTIQGEVKLNGFWGDASKLGGAGRILITEGKLWELNLFKGFGKLLFAEDLANIVFEQGSADFIIQNKYITSDNIALKSNLANLTGSCKIGFDGSLESSVNVEVSSESVPLTGTFKDVTTAIIGQSGRFGTLKITGTLKEPKYKFSADVVNILDTLKNIILENIQR